MSSWKKGELDACLNFVVDGEAQEVIVLDECQYCGVKQLHSPGHEPEPSIRYENGNDCICCNCN